MIGYRFPGFGRILKTVNNNRFGHCRTHIIQTLIYTYSCNIFAQPMRISFACCSFGPTVTAPRPAGRSLCARRLITITLRSQRISGLRETMTTTARSPYERVVYTRRTNGLCRGRGERASRVSFRGYTVGDLGNTEPLDFKGPIVSFQCIVLIIRHIGETF